MSVQDIIAYPNALLRQQATAVTEFDQTLTRLVEHLTDTLYATPGIGLCAPQLGQSRRIAIMDLSEDQTELDLYINPVIIKKSGFAIADEGCLSIPGVTAKVIRSAQILVRAQTVNGEPFERELDGMHAVCMQHEIDHLDGILFFDRLSSARRLIHRRALRRLENNEAQQTAEAV